MPEPDGYENISSKITAYNEIVCNIRGAANKGLVGVNVPDIASLSIRKRLEADGFNLTSTNDSNTWIYWGE